jgi:UDP-GlcNAc:undecaprenyl-phosphate GlcNAc-1-phosphate transferase
MLHVEIIGPPTSGKSTLVKILSGVIKADGGSIQLNGQPVSPRNPIEALAAGLGYACLGFLPHNLRRGAPARIFLGDGGSMPIGFIVAALAMNIPVDERLGWPVLLTAALFLAIPVLDTLLVVVSRTRRRVSIVTAGRDHLTHRLHTRLASARAVAVTLALTQAWVSLFAIVAARTGRTTIIVTALIVLGDPAPFRVAVTGGSGRYKGVEGEIAVDPASETQPRGVLTFHLQD